VTDTELAELIAAATEMISRTDPRTRYNARLRAALGMEPWSENYLSSWGVAERSIEMDRAYELARARYR